MALKNVQPGLKPAKVTKVEKIFLCSPGIREGIQ